ncbi:putative glycosyltransferase [Cupriavidus sp. HMR-1]|nr:putative glycosyltransferase [Cupriavidus sp. HMR-1]
MASAFADADFDSILWVDPYPTRLPNLSDLHRLRGRTSGMARVAAKIELMRTFALPIEPLPLGSFLNHRLCWARARRRLHQFASDSDHCVIGVGRPSALAEWALANLAHERSFIDILDNFPAFYGGLSKRSMHRRLRKLCGSVTDVFCSSSHLAGVVRKIREDATIVLNGYPTAHLPEPSKPAMRKYIGYVGTIGNWFDWKLVIELGRALPHATIRLIGPEFIPRPSDLPPNVEMLGERPFEEMARLVSEFAVGLIPFRVNELTEGVDPIKFYEYRSLGVPIWSTRFGEMRSRGADDGVFFIRQGDDWEALWNQANAIRFDEADIFSFRSDVTWARRLEPILDRAIRPRGDAVLHPAPNKLIRAPDPDIAAQGMDNLLPQFISKQ